MTLITDDYRLIAVDDDYVCGAGGGAGEGRAYILFYLPPVPSSYCMQIQLR